MQNLLQREGINLGEEQVKLLLKSDEGKNLINRLKHLAPTNLSKRDVAEAGVSDRTEEAVSQSEDSTASSRKY